MSRDTIGKISSELRQKECDNTHTATEQMQEQLSDYDRNIYSCVDRYKKKFVDDFYVVVLTKKEKLMQNVIRNYFTGRLSCPTPEWDQTVYKYHKKHDKVEFLWVIPSKETCKFLTENALLLPLDQKELLQFVLSFQDGTLLNIAKNLNDETKDTGQLILH